MVLTRLTVDGRVTLPKELRLAAGLHDGTELEAEVVNDGILLRPCAKRDPDQAWYWTPEWQEGEKQIEVDRAAGRLGPVFDSADEFLDALRAQADRPSEPSVIED
ncbi:MAG: AbrB/MazE/SpoVT family DNA-binding domain-containing protein [Acidimicrobiaceae bacterium]|uniref:AbrB/MazE/SpoVT family DNA-binding domain-containing protein n=1 Tax=Candidatus Poriferisodalis multihospitum TaxID=2983191 RepID=UPI00239413F0|nr:AbrB/MazE/SpoVT family DNA-binding domain-containing protein [Candidatus Poriferisodalis multihospitum]MDE0133818.1 AbrB/MazE/SpoVT family DNA-binding domain-containing protein [Acidimicrobiaceae bacterium]MDE0498708.1 AbrB/MazE/SpoVT family DNA-binding domain-containing protein [Acidimicrobiaceae bacterium]